MNNFFPRVVHVIIAVVFAWLRISGVKGEAFQAFAHLYVAGILGYYWGTGKRFYLALGVILSLIELACFIYNATHMSGV